MPIYIAEYIEFTLLVESIYALHKNYENVHYCNQKTLDFIRLNQLLYLLMKQIIVGVKCVYLFKQLLWPLPLKTQLWAAHNNKVSITFLFASCTQIHSIAIFVIGLM